MFSFQWSLLATALCFSGAGRPRTGGRPRRPGRARPSSLRRRSPCSAGASAHGLSRLLAAVCRRRAQPWGPGGEIVAGAAGKPGLFERGV